MSFWLGVACGVIGVFGLTGIGLVVLWLWGMADWRRFGAS